MAVVSIRRHHVVTVSNIQFAVVVVVRAIQAPCTVKAISRTARFLVWLATRKQIVEVATALGIAITKAFVVVA